MAIVHVHAMSNNFDEIRFFFSNFILISFFSIAEEKKNAGNENYKAQNYKLALRLYSDAIAICPDTPAYYGNRAACYMMPQIVRGKGTHDKQIPQLIDTTMLYCRIGNEDCK